MCCVDVMQGSWKPIVTARSVFDIQTYKPLKKGALTGLTSVLPLHMCRGVCLCACACLCVCYCTVSVHIQKLASEMYAVCLLCPAVSRIRTPTLLIAGTLDETTPLRLMHKTRDTIGDREGHVCHMCAFLHTSHA